MKNVCWKSAVGFCAMMVLAFSSQEVRGQVWKEQKNPLVFEDCFRAELSLKTWIEDLRSSIRVLKNLVAESSDEQGYIRGTTQDDLIRSEERNISLIEGATQDDPIRSEERNISLIESAVRQAATYFLTNECVGSDQEKLVARIVSVEHSFHAETLEIAEAQKNQ